MFNKDEAMMLFTMVERTSFQGKDAEKVLSLLRKLDKHIIKLIEKEKS